MRTGAWPQRPRDVEELEKIVLEDARAGMSAERILQEIEGAAGDGGGRK